MTGAPHGGRGRTLTLAGLLTVVACLSGAGVAHGAATITELPGFNPHRINASGAMLGSLSGGGVGVWKNGQTTTLASAVTPTDLADDGTVLGTARINDQGRYAFWIDGTGQPVELVRNDPYWQTRGGKIDAHTISPDGERFGGYIHELAFNKARQAAARGLVPGPHSQETGAPGDFTTPNPYQGITDITNTGRAIGSTGSGGFIWEPADNQPTPIPFHAFAINESGWVAGRAVAATSNTYYSAWQLRSPAGVVTTLPCGIGSVGDINEAGHVLGYEGTSAPSRTLKLWRDGTCHTVADLLGEAGVGWTNLAQGQMSLNDQGEIVGAGIHNGTYVGYLIKLDPVITVTETTDEEDADADDGVCDVDPVEQGSQCTLRAAIGLANDQEGEDEIEFDVGDGGRETIVVTEALPEVTGETVIDATSQPGATAGEPPIALDGSGAGNVDGLRILGADSVVRGLNVHDFEKSGVVLAGDGGHKLEGSWIGFKPEGSGFAAAGNGSGVDVGAANITVGGDTPAKRNVISANGNVAGTKAFMEGLDGGDVAQAALHDTFTSLGTGIVVSDGDAATVTIAGNWIGPDPDGGRFGAAAGLSSTFGVMVGPENGISTTITIGGETDEPGSGPGNVISGNIIGVLAMPDPATAGVVDGLDVRGNLIGADPDGTAGPGLGGVMGVTVLDRVTDVDVAKNRIQGNALGVMVKEEGVRIQDNLIGTDEDLDSLKSEMTSTYPTLGLHNMIGVVLGDTEQALLGGPGDLGNDILGNLIGTLIAGQQSHDNAVLGNTFGLTADPGAAPDLDTKLGDLGSVIGLLIAGGQDNDVGDAGAGNVFQSNAFGLLKLAGSGGHVQANRFHGNVFGMGAAQTSELLIGGSDDGQGNELTANSIGAMLLGWSPTEEELAAARVDGDTPVGEDDRALALTAPASQGPLNLVDATTSATVDEDSVAIGSPPGGASPARSRLRRASTGHRIVGNRVGVRADASASPNYVGAWLAGTHTDVEVRENTIARNYGGGLWVGSPVALGSQVPEPTGVELTSNRIFENYAPGNSLVGVPALGLDLLEPKPEELVQQAYGATANDAGDVDAGANGRQNTPVLATAERQGDTVLVTGTLSSKASGTYQVELFANARCNAFGSGEGEIPVGGGPFAVSSSGGAASFSREVAVPASATRISAAATGAEGTSEFSACATITDAPDPGDPPPGDLPPGDGTPPPPGTPPPGPGPGPGPLPGGPTAQEQADDIAGDAKTTNSGTVTVSGTTSGGAATFTGTSAGAGSRAIAAATLRVFRVKRTLKPGKFRLTLKPTKKAKRILQRKKRLRIKLTVGFKPTGSSVTATARRTLTLRVRRR